MAFALFRKFDSDKSLKSYKPRYLLLIICYPNLKGYLFRNSISEILLRTESLLSNWYWHETLLTSAFLSENMLLSARSTIIIIHQITLNSWIIMSSYISLIQSLRKKLCWFHFRSLLIRQVSCYTLTIGFQLPWPPTCCLHKYTSFAFINFNFLWDFQGCHHVANSAYQNYGPLDLYKTT